MDTRQLKMGSTLRKAMMKKKFSRSKCQRSKGKSFAVKWMAIVMKRTTRALKKFYRASKVLVICQ